MPPLPDWLMSGLFTAAITWGAIRVEVRYLRRDVDRAHWRLDQLPCSQSRHSNDCPHKEGP